MERAAIPDAVHSTIPDAVHTTRILNRIARAIALPALCSAVLILSACSRAAETGLNPGDNAPALDLVDLDGAPLKLSEHKGKVVLLNFWASWCAPCIAEMPALERVYNKLKSKGFVVFSVAVDDEVQALKEFQHRFSLTFPIAVDKQGISRSRYKITGYPETFVIDRAGKFRLFSDPENGMPTVRMVGPRHWDSPNAVVRLSKILEEQAPPA